MTELIRAIQGSEVVYRLGWTLVHSLWLGAAVGAAFAAAMVLLRRRSAHLRYLAGCAALALTVAALAGTFVAAGAPAPAREAAPPPALSAVAHPEAPATPSPAPMAASALPPPQSAPPAPLRAAPLPVVHETPREKPAAARQTPWTIRARRAMEPALLWVVLGWAAGVMGLSVWQLAGCIAASRLKRLATQPGSAAMVGKLQRLGRVLRVSRPVRLLESMLVRVPTVIGWLRPVILLPVGLAAGLTPQQVEAILAHELAHIRRHDYLVNLLQTLAETLLFYHPAVWFISRRIRAEREKCCDDVAVSAGAERFSYAESLIHVLRQAAHNPRRLAPARGASLGAMPMRAANKASELRGRIMHLLGAGPAETPRNWPAATAVLAGVVIMATVLVSVWAGPAVRPNSPQATPVKAAKDANAPATPSTSSGPWRPAESAEAKRTAELIGRLGSTKYEERAAAQRALVEMGWAAVPALRETRRHKDPEVSSRAEAAVEEILARIETRRDEARAAAQQAANGEDANAARGAYLALLAVPQTQLRDARAAIKYFEAHQDWPALATAYEAAAEEMWRVTHLPPEAFTRPAPAPPGGPGNLRGNEGGPAVQVQTALDGEWSNCMGTAESWGDWLRRRQNDLVIERLATLDKLGKLCLDRLDSPRRAVAAYQAACRDVPLYAEPLEKLIPQMWPKRTVGANEVIALNWPAGGAQIRADALSGLADAQARAGDLRAAAETRTRAMLCMLIPQRGDWNAHGCAQQAEAFWRIVRGLPAGEPLPPTLWLNVLDANTPAMDFPAPEDGPHKYPLSFPGPRLVIRPGHRAKTLTVSADMETPGGSGGVRCFTMIDGKVNDLGRVNWHKDDRKGREWRTATFDVPEGVGIIRLEITPYNGSEFHVRALKVAATFAGGAATQPAVSAKELKARAALAAAVPRAAGGDAENRQRFLDIERFARMDPNEQARDFARFYRHLAPRYMNPIFEGILSSNPTSILDRDSRKGFRGGLAVWGQELAQAAADLTPEQVADKLKTSLWLNVGARARAIHVLKSHPKETEALIREDLQSRQRVLVDQAVSYIASLKSRAFTDTLLNMFLADDELSDSAGRALPWDSDPAILQPVLAKVEKDSSFLTRHLCHSHIQRRLWRKPADPIILRLLDSGEAEVRYCAASAMYECVDANLAQPLVKLAGDREPRIRVAAAYMVANLPADAYAAVRGRLLPLLSDKDESVRFEAIGGFAKRKELAVGPVILEMLSRPALPRGPRGYDIVVIQGLFALAGDHFGYVSHEWGPASPGNAKAIAAFRAWLETKGVPVPRNFDAGSGAAPAAHSASRPAGTAEIGRLIQQLGSASFAQREAAQKALVQIGLSAVAALEEAVSDKDTERSQRAQAAYKQIEAAAWGADANGLQARLRPLRSVWKPGQTPVLTLDVRNGGNAGVEYSEAAMLYCQVQVDGNWYGWGKPFAIGMPVTLLAPGKEVSLKVELTDSWATPPGFAPGVHANDPRWLVLSPGRHIVRVSFTGYPVVGKREGGIRCVSNEVYVEVGGQVPPEPATQPAGSASSPHAGSGQAPSTSSGDARAVTP